MEQNRCISLLGSTGSIGRQSLDVIAACGMRVAALTANRDVEQMEKQCRRFQPELAVMMDPEAAASLRLRLADTPIRVAEGMEGLMAQPDGGDDEQDDGRTATFPFLSQLFGGGSGPSGEPPKGEKNAANGKGERPPKRKFLENYCISLTKKAQAGQLDRLIGRDRELERVIQILNRRQKNNPCLIGEPGVGKTAIAIVNLPPRKMMGIDSCGMIISAVHHEEGVEKLHCLMVDDHIPAGAKLY